MTRHRTDPGTSGVGRENPAGATSRSESEEVLRRNRVGLERQGVVFCDIDTGMREYSGVVEEHFDEAVHWDGSRFTGLNPAVRSAGSFVYVPPGVEVEVPLETNFRANAENRNRFERTLLVADEGAKVRYTEGCSAPVFSADALRSAVIEIVVKPNAQVTHTAIQNWSKNVFYREAKRAVVAAEGRMRWIDGNFGGGVTMTYPTIVLAGPGATGEMLSVGVAGVGQHHHVGARMVHSAPETTSTIMSKAISSKGGRSTHRSLVRVEADAYGCRSRTRCDALMLDDDSFSEIEPEVELGMPDARANREAIVSKVGEDQLFYLMSRGLSRAQAMAMVVNGFIEPVTRNLPVEYAVEWSRLIDLQLEGRVG